jgi:CubicO group peptidase (beta-lactamase class C family)
MQDVTGKLFQKVMQDLVLGPMGMTTAASISRQVPRSSGRAVSGHFSDGKELPGRWPMFPEHAAAGLWSTPTDLPSCWYSLPTPGRA